MKNRSVLLTVVICFVCLSPCFAQNWAMGRWKLNETNSKFLPGVAKPATVVYEAAGDKIECTKDGVDGQGKPLHTVWTGKFDGKYYPLAGDPEGDMRAYKKVNDREMQELTSKDGNVTRTNRVVNNGESISVITSRTDQEGEKMYSVGVYEKQ